MSKVKSQRIIYVRISWARGLTRPFGPASSMAEEQLELENGVLQNFFRVRAHPKEIFSERFPVHLQQNHNSVANYRYVQLDQFDG